MARGKRELPKRPGTEEPNAHRQGKYPQHLLQGQTGGHWEATERQIGVAKPVSGKQASSAPGRRRVMTSAPRQTLIEQKLIEINTPEDISTSWYELINSPVQSEILP